MILLFLLIAAACQGQTVLVVTADASDYLLSAGGTLAAMIDKGASVYVLRVTNDEKDSWNLSPEETARQVRLESEEAGKILGVKEVIPLGYRAWELADVSFTEMRDRIIFHIRHLQPQVLFIPNPHTEHNRVLDRYYAGAASEDAWHKAGLGNVQVAHAAGGLKPHVTPELYYYAQPFDPRRNEPESTATFVPQPRATDITRTLERKIRAIQALATINTSMAQRLRQRLDSTGRRLPLLDRVDTQTVRQLVEENVRGLARIGGRTIGTGAGEEFRYAGPDYRKPIKLQRP